MKNVGRGFTGLVGLATAAFLFASPTQAAIYTSLAAYNAAVSPDFVITDTNPDGATIVGFVATVGAADTPPSGLVQTNAFLDTQNAASGHNFNFIFNSGTSPIGAVNSGTLSFTATQEVLLKFGDNMIALAFNIPITSLSFAGLFNALSHVDLGTGGVVINPNILTPIPGAAVLFGSALAGLALLSRRRNKRKAQLAAA